MIAEATLLSAMENPTKYMDTQNKQLAETLKSTGGLGTVATRADIIEKLFNSFLIEKRGKDIHITSKGRQLLDLVPEELKSPTTTVEVDVITWNGFGRATAPTGVKTSLREVQSFPQGGVDQVISEVEYLIASELIGMSAEDIEDIDLVLF